MSSLVVPTLRTSLVGATALGVLLFLPAGTLDYWQAWVFIVVFMTSANAIGVYLSSRDPELLERRKKGGPAAEQSLSQRIIMSLALIAVVAMLVFPALDHRLGWSPVPAYVSLAGDALIVLAFVIFFRVFRENTYGGATVEVFEGQKVISTGPYAIVRHPMYAGVLVMVVGVPLALGSWLGLVVVALTLPALVWRILDEERLLRKDLSGYEEYANDVRYRLVPYVW